MSLRDSQAIRHPSPQKTASATGKKTRIGIAGYGFIGRHLLRTILDNEEQGLELAFIWNRDPSKLSELPRNLVLDDLAEAADHAPDLVVECAHPDITRRYGEIFLRTADYLPLSVNALADAQIEAHLTRTAQEHGKRLFIPHGALIGLENLVEVRDTWEEVSITFRKHPANIDFADSGINPADITQTTVLYDGPVRGIAHLFPRNVNTMTTCALATVGLDRCRGILIADPSLDVAIAEVRARGKDGSLHESRKVQPVVGVSGTEMLAAQLGSVLRAANIYMPGLNYV